MLATKLLRINSKYRTPGSASCTDFSVNIASRDCEGISQCVLLSATIPRVFGNVYVPNNVLNATVSTRAPAQFQKWDIYILLARTPRTGSGVGSCDKRTILFSPCAL